MANSVDRKKTNVLDNNANQTSHYNSLAIGLVIGLAGVFVRFIQDSVTLSMISNVLLVIGTIVAFRAVFRIMK